MVPTDKALHGQAIDKEESKVSVSDRKILLVLAKPEDAQGHWPRLLKGTSKTPNVKVLLVPYASFAQSGACVRSAVQVQVFRVEFCTYYLAL